MKCVEFACTVRMLMELSDGCISTDIWLHIVIVARLSGGVETFLRHLCCPVLLLNTGSYFI